MPSTRGYDVSGGVGNGRQFEVVLVVKVVAKVGVDEETSAVVSAVAVVLKVV